MKLTQILQFLHEVEHLKKEMRHSRMSNGRHESVAEHCRRVALMVILLAPKLKVEIDIQKALKIAIIHDINEAYVGDVPAFDQDHYKQAIAEKENMEELKEKYKSPLMDEIYELWLDYEHLNSWEAKLVKAIDKMEVRIQHNEADISTWNDMEFSRALFAADKYCECDDILVEFNNLIKEESREKIQKESEKDLDELEQIAIEQQSK